MENFFAGNGEIIIRLTTAVLLGILIGLERVLVHKEAGMKTHALVAMGSALFVIISEFLALNYPDAVGFDPGRIASQIIVGIGFFAAGSIILPGSRVRGLTTASGMWVTAGIGMAAGFGFLGLAIIATALILLIQILINFIERPVRDILDQKDDQS